MVDEMKHRKEEMILDGVLMENKQFMLYAYCLMGKGRKVIVLTSENDSINNFRTIIYILHMC